MVTPFGVDGSLDLSTAAQLATAVAGARRVWVVIYDEPATVAVMPQRLAALAPTFRLVQSTDFRMYIHVLLYERVS